MSVTRQRYNELIEAEKKLKAMQEMVSGKKSFKNDEVDIEDEQPEVHFSSGKTTIYQQPKIPAKMLPQKEKRGLFGLRRKKDDSRYGELQKIKEKVTEESPEIMFQKWLDKKCKQNCHLCESCVKELEEIFLERWQTV